MLVVGLKFWNELIVVACVISCSMMFFEKKVAATTTIDFQSQTSSSSVSQSGFSNIYPSTPAIQKISTTFGNTIVDSPKSTFYLSKSIYTKINNQSDTATTMLQSQSISNEQSIKTVISFSHSALASPLSTYPVYKVSDNKSIGYIESTKVKVFLETSTKKVSATPLTTSDISLRSKINSKYVINSSVSSLTLSNMETSYSTIVSDTMHNKTTNTLPSTYYPLKSNINTTSTISISTLHPITESLSTSIVSSKFGSNSSWSMTAATSMLSIITASKPSNKATASLLPSTKTVKLASIHSSSTFYPNISGVVTAPEGSTTSIESRKSKTIKLLLSSISTRLKTIGSELNFIQSSIKVKESFSKSSSITKSIEATKSIGKIYIQTNVENQSSMTSVEKQTTKKLKSSDASYSEAPKISGKLTSIHGFATTQGNGKPTSIISSKELLTSSLQSTNKIRVKLSSSVSSTSVKGETSSTFVKNGHSSVIFISSSEVGSTQTKSSINKLATTVHGSIASAASYKSPGKISTITNVPPGEITTITNIPPKLSTTVSKLQSSETTTKVKPDTETTTEITPAMLTTTITLIEISTSVVPEILKSTPKVLLSSSDKNSIRPSSSLKSVILVSSLIKTSQNTTVPKVDIGTDKLLIVLRIPLNVDIQSESVKKNLSTHLGDLYITASNIQKKRKRRNINNDVTVLIDNLSRRNADLNETVDVEFYVFKNNSVIPANEAVVVYGKLSFAQMDQTLGYAVLDKPTGVSNIIATDNNSVALWIIIIAITAPIILVLFLCNIICCIKYRSSKKQNKLQPLKEDDNNGKPMTTDYDFFKAAARNLEYEIKSPVYMDSNKSVGIHKDDFNVIPPKRQSSRRKIKKTKSINENKEKEMELVLTNNNIEHFHMDEEKLQNSVAGKLVNLTKTYHELQVNPLHQNTGVRFNLNIISQESSTQITPKVLPRKVLPPLDISSLRRTSFQQSVSIQDNNIGAMVEEEANNKHEVLETNLDEIDGKEESKEFGSKNIEELTELERNVMKEKEIIEKIRNKERARNREKSKYLRKMKRLETPNLLTDQSPSPILPTKLKNEKRKSSTPKKKGSMRKRITMNSVSPSILDVSSESEVIETKEDEDVKTTQRSSVRRTSRLENSRCTYEEQPSFRHFTSSTVNTHNTLYPLAPAFPIAAQSYYQAHPFQPNYQDFFIPPSMEDSLRPALTLNSFHQHIPKDLNGHPSPLILPNGRCQPRKNSSIRMVAESELENLEQAQQRARKKMKYVLEKSVNQHSSLNMSVADC